LRNRKKILSFIISITALSAVIFSSINAWPDAKTYRVDYNKFLLPKPDPDLKDTSHFEPYLAFLKEIYDTMDREYYLPVSKEVYESFKETYMAKVLSRLRDKEHVIPEIKFWGAGLLVSKLREPEDTFSNFFPPKEAEEFKSEVLGYSLGIGITGEMTPLGWFVKKVELRSDSYKKGIKPGDTILKINGRAIKTMDEKTLNDALFPSLGSILTLEFLSSATGKVISADVEVIEFFKETLSSVPTGIPGMFYVKINQFNKATGKDFTNLLRYFTTRDMRQLVIDLRGNGGGPPLAAREISGIFLPPGTELFYFQRKNRPKILLRTLIPPFQYTGKIAILINRGSGSASELFAGTLRTYDRAILIGTEPSAGKTFLKSMFNFDDKSTLFLVTSMAYLYNGEVYDLNGLQPDFIAPEKANLFGFIAKSFDSYYEQ